MNRSLTFLWILVLPVFAASQPQTIIEFKQTKHDFGLVKEEGGLVEHTFLFQNKGENPLKIDDVKPVCGCTTSGWSAGTIAPGEMGFVRAAFDPFNRPGSFLKTLTVYANTHPNPIKLTISGYVKPRPRTSAQEYPTKIGGIRMKYAALHMGNIKNHALASKQFEIYNDSSKPIRFLDNIDKPEHISISFKPDKLGPGEVGTIEVGYDVPALDDLGFRADDIVVRTNENEEDGEKPLRVVAMIEDYFPPMTAEEFSQAPRIAFEQTSQDFGPISQGDTVAVDFVLSNTGKDPLAIKQIKTSCDCLYVEQDKAVVPAGENAKLQVIFDSSGRRGDQVKSATIFTNDPREPIKTIVIKGRVE